MHDAGLSHVSDVGFLGCVAQHSEKSATILKFVEMVYRNDVYTISTRATLTISAHNPRCLGVLPSFSREAGRWVTSSKRRKPKVSLLLLKNAL